MKATMLVTGLCAFVPASGGVFKVVLPNAKDHQHGAIRDSHYPALLTLEKHLTPSNPPPIPISTSRSPDFGFDGTATFGYQRMAGFILDNEALEIDKAAGPVALDMTTLGGDCPKQPGDFRSLLWASQMKTLGSPVMSADAFYFTQPSLVAAQMVLRGGSLATSGFAKNYRGKILKWEFKQGGTTLQETRALAEEIEYSIDIAASLRFLSSRSTGSIIRDIELFPDANGTLACWLVNQPLEDMLFNRSVEPRPPIDHFDFFFGIAKGTPPSYIPYPVLDLCASTIGGASSPRCPVAFFDSHE